MNFLYNTGRRIAFGAAAALWLVALSGSSPQGDYSPGRRFDVDLYGNVYLLDPVQSTLTLMSRAGDTLRTIGGAGWGNQEFDRPAGVWARNGMDVFVADYGNHRIQRFDRNLNYVSSFSTRDSDTPYERFGYPADVAFSRLGDLFIIDSENIRIMKVNSSNTVERTFGGIDAGKGRVNNPTRIDVGPNDNVYVLDGSRIVIFDAFGNYMGLLYPDLLSAPSCLVADPSGVTVADRGTVFSFDADHRAVWSMRVDSLRSLNGASINDISVSGTMLQILTNSGIVRTTVPAGLDKEKNSK
jgi:DNA-binding beta-propeller fold protein YncE